MATLISKWDLSESAGATVAVDSLGASNGQYLSSPTLAAAGHWHGASNGGNAVTTAAGSPGGRISLGLCSTIASDITGDGVTFCFWFKDGGIPATVGPHYVCGCYDTAGPVNGFDLSIRNAAFGGEGFTLTVITPAGSTHSRRFIRNVGESPLCDGQWHHVCLRIKLVVGFSSAGQTMEVLVDGIPMKISTAWSDVATDALVASALTNFGGFPVLLGGRTTTAGGGTTIAATFQFARQYRGLLTDAEVIDLMRSTTNQAGIGAADAFCEFDFTLPYLYQDTAGTTAVTASGQTVRRVNARAGQSWYLTTGSVGTSPVWNGAYVESQNQYGSGAAWQGWTLNGHTSNKLRQFRMSAAAVVSPVAASVANTGGSQRLLVLRGTGSAWSLSVIADTAAVDTGTIGTNRGPATPTSMDNVKSLPSWCLIAGSTGCNGSGAENDGTDFGFMVDDTIQGNAAAAGSAINGTYWNSLTSAAAYVGADDPVGNAGLGAGSGFAGLWRKLVIYNRPLHKTAEMPYMRGWSEAAYPDLSRPVSKVRVGFFGDSITSSNAMVNPIGGYQSLIGSDFNAATVCTNLSLGGYDAADLNTRSDSAAWASQWPAACPRLAIVFIGTNDIINPAKWVNQTTLQTRITTLIGTIRSRFGATIPIVIVVPRSDFSNALAPPASSAALLAWLQSNTSLYTVLVQSGTYATGDGTHPTAAGHAAIAALLRTAIGQAQPNALRRLAGSATAGPIFTGAIMGSRRGRP